jgi:hypothetical protein
VSWDAVLIDFDETLADTRHIKSLRDAHQWGKYFTSVAEAPDVLDWTGEPTVGAIDRFEHADLPFAVVTTSPDMAVRIWFEAKGLQVPEVIVGYHQTQRHKPDPAPLSLALQQLRVPPSTRVLSIGDQDCDVVAAMAAGITPGTFSYEVNVNNPPRVYVGTAGDATHPAESFTLAGEHPSFGGSHRGRRTLAPAVLVATVESSHYRNRTHRLFFGGLYEKTTRAESSLAAAILQSKQLQPSSTWPGHLQLPATCLVRAALSYVNADACILTAIPPTGGHGDRFRGLLEAVSTQLNQERQGHNGRTHLRYEPACLSLARQVSKQTDLGREARYRNLQDAFTGNPSMVANAQVVVFDDVYTTGATFHAAASALLAAGAAEVMGVFLARTEWRNSKAWPALVHPFVSDVREATSPKPRQFKRLADALGMLQARQGLPMNQPRDLPDLVVEIDGVVRRANVEDYRAAALEYVNSIKTDLQTDDDFIDAASVSKWCKNAEKKIKTVKASAMAQASEINAVFSALDEISAALRDKRLTLDKQVKAQKATRKQEAFAAAMSDLITFVAELESTLDGLKLPEPVEHKQDLEAAAKNKRTLSSLRSSLAAAVRAAKADYKEQHQVMLANVATLQDHRSHAFLFSDAQKHINKAPDDFANLVKVRITDHIEAEKQRLQAEREKIREEERAKIIAESMPSLSPASDAMGDQSGGQAAEHIAADAAQHLGPPENCSNDMQTIMYELTKLAAERGFGEFLSQCGLSAADYEAIKIRWRETLGVEPFC